MSLPAFHLAFPVTDLAATRHFYCNTLGCEAGRSSQRWLDFDFHGHQLSAHLVSHMPTDSLSEVDGKAVPLRHFGLILDWDSWHRLKDNLVAQHVDFLIDPHTRFAHDHGEQVTFFIQDPSGNTLEFKAFRNSECVFSPSS